jgi:hypothetical protein
MVILEALNALYGDCLLLRYPGPDKKERLWIIDGGPKPETVGNKKIVTWKDVLLPRLREINPSTTGPLPVALGMVSHIDDDHIYGILKLTNGLVAARASEPAAVKFDRFWFNSFDKLVGPKPEGLAEEVKAETASMQSVFCKQNLPGVDDEHAEAIMESIGQGNALTTDLKSLRLNGNQPIGDLVVAKKGQKTIPVEGADITIIGPMHNRLEALRLAWAKALQKPTKTARQAALQELFLPKKDLDKSIPNLSSIVILVKVEDKKLLLTGDAHGDDIVTAWKELGLPSPAALDVLKMPHHGSIRNTTEQFLRFFLAEHYVFSANGKYDNPDAPTLEALVKMHCNRKITMHFTNAEVVWKKPYKLDKGKAKARNLLELIDALHAAYPGPWTTSLRKREDKSVVVKLS